MRLRHFAPLVLAAACAVGFSGKTLAAEHANLDCKLKFSLTGWAAIYKHAEGHGVITCDNHHSYKVHIRAVGGGLTVGKYKVENGTGNFTDVHTVNELFGDYVQAEANAGVVKSGTAQVLTKGSASLALAGAGEGVDLGISVGKFTISRAR